jgi:hypothetical protein
MSIPIVLNYNDENDYYFENTDIEVTGGKGQLKLQQSDIDFIEDFADDTDFTYDSDLVEFISSMVRQIDKRPANTIFYASYTNNENGSWGNGTLTGTLGGSASVHDGYLDALDGYVEYPIDNFSSMSNNAGCIRKRISFNYTGAASNVQYIIQTSPNTASRVYLVHNDVYIQCYIFNNVGALIYNMTFGWTPSSTSTIYEFEINWNSTNGYIFINGNLEDSDIGSLTIGTPSLFRIGGGTNTAFKIYDIAVFNTLQHSSNYTPDWSNFYESAYLGSSIILPEMEHTGDGSIKLFNSLTMIYSGLPRILLEIGRSGDKLYWDGDSWEVSDETYDQATDPVTFNTNCGSLEVDGEKYGQFTLIFPDSNIISFVSNLTVNMNVDIGYLTTNPKIRPKLATKIDGLENWLEIVEKSGSDDVKATCELNSIEYYYNGSAWAVSSGYSQSNTIAEILAQKESLLTEGDGKYFRPVRYLHSADGSTTPKIDTDTLSVNFSGIAPTIKEIFIYGNLRDSLEGIDDDIIYYRETWTHGLKTIIVEEYEEYTVLTDGYIEIPLRYEEGYKPSYIEMKIKNKYIKFNFPSDELLESGDYIEIGNLEIAVIQNINL